MTLNDHDTKEIFERLARIEALLEERRGPSTTCAVHGEKLEHVEASIERMDKRLGRNEATVGRHGLISAVISATVAGIVLTAKYIATGGKP